MQTKPQVEHEEMDRERLLTVPLQPSPSLRTRCSLCGAFTGKQNSRTSLALTLTQRQNISRIVPAPSVCEVAYIAFEFSEKSFFSSYIFFSSRSLLFSFPPLSVAEYNFQSIRVELYLHQTKCIGIRCKGTGDRGKGFFTVPRLIAYVGFNLRLNIQGILVDLRAELPAARPILIGEQFRVTNCPSPESGMKVPAEVAVERPTPLNHSASSSRARRPRFKTGAPR